MSPEEAGHIILESEQWVDCPVCDGRGLIVKEPAVGHRAALNYSTSKAVAADECQWCNSGRLANPYYLRACKVLGLPYKPDNWIRADPFVGRISRVYTTKLEVYRAETGARLLYERGDI